MKPDDTALRIELLERDAMADMYAAAPAGFAEAVGLRARQLGSALALSIRAVPEPFFNRAFAMGLVAPSSVEELDAVRVHYRDEGIARWWLQPSPHVTPSAALTWPAERGFALAPRLWAKFARAPGAAPEVATELRIAEIGPDRAQDFAAAVTAGFGAPPPFGAWQLALVGRPGWRCYVAYDGARPVGAGALRLSPQGAWLGIGATVPEARGRGAQRALLAHRIADASTAGAPLIATETGLPLPGEAAPSFRNIGRAGFVVAHLRPNFEPAQ